MSSTPDSKPSAYIASPMGFSEAGRYYYSEVYLPELSKLVDPVDPWQLTSADEVLQAQSEDREAEFAIVIGTRNAEAIEGSQLLIANLDGQECDAGTVAEVGYAAALGLPCYAVRSDFRQSGENGSPVNLQVMTFIVRSGGFIASSLDELIRRLRSEGIKVRTNA